MKITKKEPFPLTEKEKQWIDEVFNSLTLKEKVAQLVHPWVLGNFSSEDAPEYKRMHELVTKHKVGGLIFFKADVLNESLLISKMQKLADIPLLTASDFERGLAMRLPDGLEFPFNMGVAAADDTVLTKAFAEAVSRECRAIGVHQNYAPVADVNSNPENPIVNIRAYSEDTELVTKHVLAFMEGCKKEKVIATVKHFPGHGDTKIDSHQDIPVIGGSRTELFKTELKPFIEAINAGVQSVMTSHLFVPALDDTENLPASLSEKIITGLLKEELGFNGLVVTDAMNMSAITNYYSVGDAAIKAINAGVDLLLMSPNEEVAIESIYNAVKKGIIKAERIDESVYKLLKAKKWLEIEKHKGLDAEYIGKIVNCKEHYEIAFELAKKSLTLVKNGKKVFPFKKEKYKKIGIIAVTEENFAAGERLFLTEMNNNFDNLLIKVLRKNATDKDYKEALLKAEASDIVILPAYIKVKAYTGTVQMSSQHEKFINKLLATGKTVVLVSFGNPYLLSVFQKIDGYVCCYGDSPVTQKAMAEVFYKEFFFTGKLPVSIPGTKYKAGYRIDKK